MSELSETAQPDDLRGLRILLVEDSPVVADALKQHLELLGATVAGPAATTAEAREVIMAGRPDVVPFARRKFLHLDCATAPGRHPCDYAFWLYRVFCASFA